jgi:hypothetical protein
VRIMIHADNAAGTGAIVPTVAALLARREAVG